MSHWQEALNHHQYKYKCAIRQNGTVSWGGSNQQEQINWYLYKISITTPNDMIWRTVVVEHIKVLGGSVLREGTGTPHQFQLYLPAFPIGYF